MDYDWINAVLSLGTGRAHRRAELDRVGIAAGMRVLDIGTGTGVLAALARERTGAAGQVVGLDPSVGMLRQAEANVSNRVCAAADRLPIVDASVDRITMGYALRHVADLRTAFHEFSRVLRPGGRLLLLEITRPTSAWGRGLLKLYVKHVAAWLALLRGRRLRDLMRFHWETIDHCVPPETILGALRDAGFTDARRDVTGAVFSAYTAVKGESRSPDPAT